MTEVTTPVHYLSGLLIAMSAGQLLGVRGFVEIVQTYRLASDGVAWPLAVGLTGGQLTAAALMLGPSRWRHGGASVAVVVAVVWTVLAVQAFLRGLPIDNCGCFGVYFGQQLRWYVLVQDAAFIAIAVWVWGSTAGWRLRGISDRDRPSTAHVAAPRESV